MPAPPSNWSPEFSVCRLPVESAASNVSSPAPPVNLFVPVVSGWNQQEFADRMGVAKSTIARIETLEMAPKSDFVLRAIGLFREAGLEVDIHSGNGIPITISSEAILSALDEFNADGNANEVA